MKTKGLAKVVTLGLILTSFVSCQEEEFYEKEFIDTLSDQYERENLPDDVAEMINEEEDANNPGTNPGDGGSTTPPIEPVPPVEPVPPIEPVPPVEPVPPIEPVPPVEPVPPIEPVDPPEDPIDPPTEPTEPEVVLVPISDGFTQNSNGAKMDILWVVDDSGSMGDEQEALGQNFSAFIKEFVNKDIDFKMAVTTTDTRTQYKGKEYKDSMTRLTSVKLSEDKDKFLSDFAEMIKVGTRGSGREKGILASEAFANNYAQQWMRSDAYLTIVYVSDESDQSEKSVQEYLTSLQKWKVNNGLIRAYSIVDMIPTHPNRYVTRGYERYKEITESTNGEVASIKGDFHSTLLNMGSSLADLTEQFPLSESPYDSSTIKVLVDDIEVSDWVYHADTNSIKFNADSVPAANAIIKVSYEKVQ